MHQRSLIQSTSQLRGDERGVSLVITAIALVVILGVAALAIDLGMAFTTRTQAQRVADAAALAGAGSLAMFPDNAEAAWLEAMEYATKYDLMNESVDESEVDIFVDVVEDTVGVTVYRDAAHANPLGTLFGGILGVGSIDINAHAVAKAQPAMPSVPCLLPLTLPDQWYEGGEDGDEPLATDEFGDDDDDFYDTEITGYDEDDVGEQLVIKTQEAPGSYNPSWWGPWRLEGTQGAEDYRSRIISCMFPEKEKEIGDEVQPETGNMAGPTRQGFDDLIDQDPTAVWDETQNCVTHGDGVCSGSPRIRPAPLFDPNEVPNPGVADRFPFANFANFFVESQVGGLVTVRFVGLTANFAGLLNDPDQGTLFKTIQLIE